MGSSSPGLESVLGHTFLTPALLEDALTHGSVADSRRTGPSPFQRLEFLGDRVLGLAIAEMLYARFPDEPEGGLGKRLSKLVDRETLAVVAAKSGLAAHVRLSESEERQGGRENPSILADCCEAVIGAIYLDGGLEPATDFVSRYWADMIKAAHIVTAEPKTALQEWAQARGLAPPVYEVIEETGPRHALTFVIEVRLDGFGADSAEGTSKRRAEQAAARRMLGRIRGESGEKVNE